MKNNILVLMFLSLFAGMSYCEDVKKTSVWEVSKYIDGNKKFLYIAGSIHTLRVIDYPLPAIFDIAFNESDELILELDSGLMNSSSSQEKFMKLMMLQEGGFLKDIISEGNYKTVHEYFKIHQIPVETFSRMSPVGISLLISQIELSKLNFLPTGVDSYFDDKAKEKEIKRSYLETIDEQIKFLSLIGDDPDKGIEYSFKDISQFKYIIDDMVDAWRAGTQLDSITTDFKIDYPEIYEGLIVERNTNWLPKIENEFQDDEIEFVLVGVGHLMGDDSLLNMLKANGYTVKQLD
ncbi:MAG: TraB/GumN family protein [Saccharospirillaceae bacterium]|nr:TraB/GumN family protein [Pseudomonadales bacterium]NRB80205.1 TraB/GumN family protein [Saccharospirillaceae bacterium]